MLQEVGRDRQAAHRRDEVQRHLVRERVQHHLPNARAGVGIGGGLALAFRCFGFLPLGLG